MVTASIPIGYEFEHQDISKIVAMDTEGSIYALAAGDVLIGTRILDLAKERIREHGGPITAVETAETIRAYYQFVRHQIVTQTVLEPRGLNLEGFYNKQQVLLPQIVQIIDQHLSEFDPGIDFIVAGPSAGGFTLHTVINPGVTIDHTPIGYCAIGSGAPHAMYSLIEAAYESSKGISDVKKLVEQAKTRSEVAPGVGSQTQTRLIPEEVSDDAT